ncbi:Type-1 angiotensin II receptor-associated protein [Oryzias melastigma]|uniref:Type-1 angiotensin II receptor-associated protein n=1 Tax=Oryzias melastigma TaxID=30732 RepID=A0A834KZI8_ORYME|nr:Type-1 angiotensin II receptor-associated protein [Oryzias melastigma]
MVHVCREEEVLRAEVGAGARPGSGGTVRSKLSVMEVPAINLKAIVLVHWLLTVWACMAWPSLSFMWGNFSVLAVGVWAIAQRDSVDAVLMFLVGIAVTILTDIIHFGVYFSSSLFDSSVFRFSAGMAILNLLFKPASCFFVYQMYRERGGEYSVNFDLETSVDSRCTTDSADSAFFGRRY